MAEGRSGVGKSFCSATGTKLGTEQPFTSCLHQRPPGKPAVISFSIYALYIFLFLCNDEKLLSLIMFFVYFFLAVNSIICVGTEPEREVRLFVNCGVSERFHLIEFYLPSLCMCGAIHGVL
jgi:hypothetical protein